MRNIKLVLQYEGTRYQGWQKQESTANTIQSKLEAVLFKMCQEPVALAGSGRTDAGVHAYGQVANFHTVSQMGLKEMMEYINRYLPEDIAVISIEEVPLRFHSRLNAKEKIYCYRVLNTEVPHVFDRRFTYCVPEALDVEAMKKAAEYLLGTKDFKAFTSAKKGKKSTVRTVYEIAIERIGEEIRFTYKGNGFLYHMVRILTGTLLEVGQGIRQPEDIKQILHSGERKNAGALVPAQGLALIQVGYDIDTAKKS